MRSKVMIATVAVLLLVALPAWAYPSVVYDSGYQSCNSGERITVSAYSYDWAKAKQDGGGWYTTDPSGEAWHRTHTRIYAQSATWVAKGPGLKEWLTYSICQAY